ncbi:MAG: biotin--[acetyl-CoA-carboxylase] ligase [Candidatus Thorarchaeota archaeon]
MVDPRLITMHLDTKRFSPELVVLKTTESTNEIAKSHLHTGSSDVVVVISETQTSGKGRHDREWFSPKGGLFMSIAIRNNLLRGNYPLVGILAGCASAVVIRDLFSISVKVKWPNDIVVNELKLGGILSELITEGDQVLGVVIGIGINQNIAIDEIPSEFRVQSTSILNEVGHHTSIEQLISGIINAFDSRFDIFNAEESFDSIMSEWTKLCGTIGKTVQVFPVDESKPTITGRAIGINKDGDLIVVSDSGEQLLINSGEVQHLRTEEE